MNNSEENRIVRQDRKLILEKMSTKARDIVLGSKMMQIAGIKNGQVLVFNGK